MQAVILTVIGMGSVFLFLYLVMCTLVGVLWLVRRFASDEGLTGEKAAALVGIALSRGMK